MATRSFSRSLVCRPGKSLSALFARSFSSSSLISKTPASVSASDLLNRTRSATAFFSVLRGSGTVAAARGFSTRARSSSLNDSDLDLSKEDIRLPGCDFEHWLVVMEKPEGELTRDEIIESYIKTFAQIVGSEEEARMKIYSVSTRCYYAFGALVTEEVAKKMRELPRVRWVLPDSYLDLNKKTYGGEPFIDGKAVPYHPKYHEEWMSNNGGATERKKRNDGPSILRRKNIRSNRDKSNRGVEDLWSL